MKTIVTLLLLLFCLNITGQIDSTKFWKPEPVEKIYITHYDRFSPGYVLVATFVINHFVAKHSKGSHVQRNTTIVFAVGVSISLRQFVIFDRKRRAQDELLAGLKRNNYKF